MNGWSCRLLSPPFVPLRLFESIIPGWSLPAVSPYEALQLEAVPATLVPSGAGPGAAPTKVDGCDIGCPGPAQVNELVGSVGLALQMYRF